jgi:hypothetical protein
MVKARIPFFFSLLFSVSSPSFAQTVPAPQTAQVSESEQLKAEIEAMRAEFANRIAALEARLKAVESMSPGPGAASAAAPSEPAAAAAPPPPPPAAASSSKFFNPDIAAIGDFVAAAGKSPGGGEPSMSMHEAEVSLQAIVDPYARADVFLTFGPDEVGVEEAFMTFPTLPGGLLMKVGKFRDAFGKINGSHNHVLGFADRPLMTQNLLGGEDGLADAGVSLSRLFPNDFAFLELTGQAFRGESSVFKAEERSDLAYVGHFRAYRDLSESTNLDLGGSFADGHNDARGKTRIWGADATFRYRPLRRSIYTHFLARTEVAWSNRSELSGPASFGGFGYLEYQFGRRWTAGTRFDLSDRATNASLRDKGFSGILTYMPSEFSVLRGQYRRTLLGDGPTNNEFLFQLQFAIGAHGAHPF